MSAERDMNRSDTKLELEEHCDQSMELYDERLILLGTSIYKSVWSRVGITNTRRNYWMTKGLECRGGFKLSRWLPTHIGWSAGGGTTGLPCEIWFPFRIDKSVCAVLADVPREGKLLAAGVAEANRFRSGRPTPYGKLSLDWLIASDRAGRGDVEL